MNETLQTVWEQEMQVPHDCKLIVTVINGLMRMQVKFKNDLIYIYPNIRLAYGEE